MIDKKYGLTLKKLRIEKGLSQEELAARVGLHRTYISQLERGLKSPSLRTIEKICGELCISLTTFMVHLEKDE
ncbi:helix-turn-helix domain-containing protein [Sporomusa sp. KB1]|jgi:transcriptional regulator with XRE-family HTH domain|uniref:helix-turn-helix domain-containing protein n=1 Tax=Sporomusa sp. KB1 TaxID=943346 RepID=UPI00119F10F6|nr:helix-turn-helix transcriptional regulator [Sporomusa sp. KB1]TWH45151.1 putative transcriptional regulator with C-terminal CBS domains [Sporomusa sp. KB1]